MGDSNEISRRDALKLSGLALGATILAGCSGAGESGVPATGDTHATPTTTLSSQQNTLFESLQPYYPGTETLAADEMRISFLDSSVIPRLAQACNSVFVELGNGDSFVFDCGAGVILKYTAMQIPMLKMDKIFLTHLHGDHTSDLTYFYCLMNPCTTQNRRVNRRARSFHSHQALIMPREIVPDSWTCT